VKKWLLMGAGLAAVLVAVWLWAASAPGPTAVDGPPVASDASPPPPASHLVEGTTVAGRVLLDGVAVPRARVSLRGARSEVASTDAEGRFEFTGVTEGLVYLSASTDDAASEVVGPVTITTAPVTDLVLTLAPAVKVEGVVVDLVARKPVVGAVVLSPQRAAVTDANGRFALSGARGATWLDVTAPGFLNRTEWVSLELARSGGLLELVLTPVSRLEGTVLEGGVKVASATVWAEQIEGANRGDRTPTAFTSKEGAFIIESPAGLVRVTGITPRGTRLKGPLLRLGIGEKKTGLVLDAGETSEAVGVVTRAGAPWAGAQLQAIDASNEDIVGVATSGLDGRFRFPALAAGRYVVQVRKGAFSTIAGPFEQAGDARSWTITIADGRALDGRVEPPTAEVRVRWRAGSWSGPATDTLTDAQGRFHFEGLPDEFISLDAEGPTGAATARVKPGDDVVLRLAHGQVVVHLADDSGRPVTDGVLLSRSMDTGAVRRQMVLAPDGVTRLDLPAGRWELTLEVAGRGRSSTAKLEVRAAPLEVRLTLERSVSVRGVVTDNATKLPVQGAMVEAMTGEVNAFRISVMTDARGAYLLPPVPVTATVVVRHDAFKSAWRRALEGDHWDVGLDALPTGAPTGGSPAQQFEGVGLVLDPNTAQGALVTSVNEGGPAERAGVQRGDLIVGIEGQPVVGVPLQDIIGRIRGPAGTEVHMTFARGAQSFELTIRRRLLTL
jgi:hypothetical protein